MTRARATTAALWLLTIALVVAGWLLLRTPSPLSASGSALQASSPPSAPSPSPPQSATTPRPARLPPAPSTTPTRAQPSQAHGSREPAVKVIAGKAPDPDPLPTGRRLSPTDAVRGYLQSRGSWTSTTTRRSLEATTSRYVTARFAAELRRRPESEEWVLAHQMNGTRRLYVDTLSLNQGAPNDTRRRFYVVRVTTVLTDQEGQVLIRRRGHSMAIAVTHQSGGWRVFTDEPMG